MSDLLQNLIGFVALTSFGKYTASRRYIFRFDRNSDLLCCKLRYSLTIWLILLGSFLACALHLIDFYQIYPFGTRFFLTRVRYFIQK